jgi:hypothetical protein
MSSVLMLVSRNFNFQKRRVDRHSHSIAHILQTGAGSLEPGSPILLGVRRLCLDPLYDQLIRKLREILRDLLRTPASKLDQQIGGGLVD